MRVEILIFLIPIFGILTGMLAIFLKHREKMAGIDGKRGPHTIQLLTETLEKQNERLHTLQQRIETLEMIVTDENAALQHQARRARLQEGEPGDVDPDMRPLRRRSSTS